MSEELINFSEQIDEQFDIADMESVESDDFWEAIANLFIWSVATVFYHLLKMKGIPLPKITLCSLWNSRLPLWLTK